MILGKLFADSRENSFYRKLLVPIVMFAVLLTCFTLFVVTRNIISFRDKIQLRTQQHQTSLRNTFLSRLQETRRLAKLINENPLVIDGLLSQSQGKILDTIVPFTDQKIIDRITIYNLNGEIIAQATNPSVFGKTDELKNWLSTFKDNRETVTTVQLLEGKLTLISGVSLQSLSGTAGSTVVGYLLNADFAKQLAESSGTDLALVYKGKTIVTSIPQERVGSYQNIPIELPTEIDNSNDFSIQLLEDNSSATLEFLRDLFSTISLFLLASIISLIFSYRTAKSLTRSHALLQEEIIERQRIEVDLKRAKEAADAANTAKSEFLANMSHELRTPLNGILGYAQILQRSPSLDHKAQDGVTTIYQCGSHLLTLINDILDLSKIEAGKFELYPIDFNLLSFLVGIVEICRLHADQKGTLVLTSKFDEALPKWAHADPKRLRQILINLIGNAIKFTDRGQVTFRVILLESGREFCGLRLEVEDTGAGISSQELERIFKPFEQVGDRKIEGTGLGLAIGQTIAKEMGSKIEVYSEPQKGSRFWLDLKLPIVTDIDTVQLLPLHNICGYLGSRKKILIIDDTYENRAVVKALLEPIGFEVFESVDGESGIENALTIIPDLILLDLGLPGLDGYGVLKYIRNSPQLGDLPVIVSSAHVFESDRDMSLRSGANDFLAKPINADLLLEKLQSTLKLNWVYDKNNKPQIGKLGIFPPKEQLTKLLDFARKGNLKEIIKLTEQMQEHDRQLIPFCHHLLNLAKEFQMKEILFTLENYINKEVYE